jgi:hypothetical protein
MHRGRTGGAGILHPQRPFEAQIRRGLQHQRGGEVLRRKSGIEVPEHDLVDLAGRDAGIGQSFVGDTHDQALHRLAVETPERGMRPSHHASGHLCLLNHTDCTLSRLVNLTGAKSRKCRIFVSFLRDLEGRRRAT